MWESSDNKMTQSARTNGTQPASPIEMPGTPARTTPSAGQNQYSMIGKSIVIKGEITASDPVYVYGRVEGLINAPSQRVTVGTEGKVKADISAREVVIMGEVCGNLDGGERVEIRSDGSVTGDLAAPRISIEEGAFVSGTIEIRKAGEAEAREAQQESDLAFEAEEATA
jgi:cytoskeletal protein CcmA (bactofilin family)